MAKIITYETKSCGRCGGSGRYSYCTMYGDTCFQCKGKGKQLSRRAAKSHAAVEAFIVEHFSKTVAEVVVGDRIKVSGYLKPKTVVEITEAGECGWCEANGVRTYYRQLTIIVNGQREGHGMFPTQRVQLALTPERFAVVAEFAATLPGVTVTEKPDA